MSQAKKSSECRCGHNKIDHYKGKGMCKGRSGMFICSCSRYRLPDPAAQTIKEAMPIMSRLVEMAGKQ